MERLFTNSGVGSAKGAVRYGDMDDYERAVIDLISDAVDFEESYLSLMREENMAFYQGQLPAIEANEDGTEPNKSTFVSTDVRDTVLTVMPSLMRIFTNFDEKIIEFIPSTAAQVELAEQQHDYLNYIFHTENDGFLTLYSVIKDALSVMYGVTKWWTDFDSSVEEKMFTNLTIEQYQSILFENPDVEVELGEQDPVTGMIDYALFRYVKTSPICRVEAVPPEEFRISRNAKNIKSAKLVGHETFVSASDLIKRGYDPAEFEEWATSTVLPVTEERQLRNPAILDASDEGIRFGEWYIRIDGDGDGIDELRRIITVGDDYHIIDDEIVSHVNMALWVSDPRSHTILSDCITEITKDIQRFKTNMMRGQMDNLAESIHPRTVINELVTNIEDAMSDEIGAIIRTRGDVGSAVHYTRTPYAGADIQETVNYLDQVRASRTGITEASKGLDPKAMQSTTLSGIDAILSGAQERIELIARILAETGLKPTFQGMLREITENPNREHVIALRGKFVEVDASLFDPTMRMRVNPTLGRGTDMIRMQALMAIQNNQLQLIERMGLGNGIVSLEQMYNVQEDMLAMANIKNVGRYFTRPTPELEQAIASAPQEPDPTALLAQAELEKVKKDTIVATIESDRKNEELELKKVKAQMDDDFRRDQLNINASLKALDINQKFVADQNIAAANQAPKGVNSEG